MPNYEQIARDIAIQQGIDPDIFTAQIKQESGFDPTARSPAGALGIAQIVPKWHPGVDPLNPLAALNYAAKHDATLLKKYGGDWRQVLSVYNSGQPDKWSDPNFSGGQTYNYVRSILGSKGSAAGGVPGSGMPAVAAVPAALSPSAAAPPSSTPPPPSMAQPNISGALLSSLGQGPKALLSSLLGAQMQAATVPKTVPLPGTNTSVPAPPTAQVPAGKSPPGLPATGGTANVVETAQQWLGTPYSWGGGSPKGPSKGFGRGANTVGFDCSSLLQYAYAKQGVSIPRVTYDQWKVGQAVPRENLRPGDAVFFRPGSRGPEHVGIYMGADRFIEAPGTGKTVRVSTLSDRGDYMGARRYG